MNEERNQEQPQGEPHQLQASPHPFAKAGAGERAHSGDALNHGNDTGRGAPAPGETDRSAAATPPVAPYGPRAGERPGYAGNPNYPGYFGEPAYSVYVGDAGYQGYPGYAGDAGYQGYPGYAGDAGYQGYSGYPGDTGNPAYSGYPGAPSNMGVAPGYTNGGVASRGRRERPPLERTPRGYPGRPKPWIAGVMSGLAVHLGTSVGTLRLLAVVLIPFGSPLLYAWLWALVPKVSVERKYRVRRIASPMRERSRESLPNAQRGVVIALVLLLAAGLAIASQLGWINLTPDWVGGALVFAGVVLIWVQAGRVKDWRDPMVLGLIATGVVLLLAGVSLILVGVGSGLLPGLMLGMALIIVLGLAFSPLLLRMNKELSSAEVARARESERADIAAHLHDSVLQTLTLIKNNADNPARVRTIALKQERELRSWLYTGTTQTSDSVKSLLKASIEAVEQMYGHEAELVTVGDAVPGPSEQAAVAAAVEAVKNAMRHGAPPIQVYAEVRDEYEIFVKDSGPGFDLADVPEDRHGVRDSIIARAERVGGRVNIRTLDPGTEIHITVPRSNMEKQ